MKRKALTTTLILCLGAGSLGGCETMGEDIAKFVPIILDGIDRDSRVRASNERVFERALVDATTGLIATIVAQELATEAQVEQEYRDAGQEVPTGPVASIRDFEVQPKQVKHGSPIYCSGSYDIVGDAGTEPYGVLEIYNADSGHHLLKPSQFEIDSRGRQVFETDIELPDDALEGDYIVELRVVNGSSESVESRRVTLS